MEEWRYSNSGAPNIDLNNSNTKPRFSLQGKQGVTGWRVEMNGKWWWRDDGSLVSDGECCLSGWLTLWSLVSKQISVKTSTSGEQLDEVCGINMLLKPVFARLCPSVPPSRPNTDWYNLLFPGQRCTACYYWLTDGLAELVVAACGRLAHPHGLHLASLSVGRHLLLLKKALFCN